MLAEKLPGETILINVKKNPSLTGYDNVILGGAVRAGEIRQGMKNYALKHLEELKNRRIALFVSCLNEDQDMIQQYFKKSFPAELVENAVAMESLGGALNLEETKFPMKIIFKIMKAKNSEKILTDNIDKIAGFFQI